MIQTNALEFEPGAFAEATAQLKNTANYLKTTWNLNPQKKYEGLQAEFHAYKQILGLIDLLEREHKAQNPATAPAIARLIEYGKNCLGSHDLTFRKKYERFHREYQAFSDIQKLIPKLQKLQANANAEEEPIAAPAIARLIQNAKDTLAGDGPSFTEKYKILKDEHAAILRIRKLISLLKTKEGNSSAIQQLIKDAQACRDARDRLLPSLSIIDSQYATT
ncbi:hypothetical protein [Candidiatus Paracoxiella cheracis]|uniref:hypothetical protein n=1 Tax=Candidiatus Paracoxiella cheracis TaxID=3405120 RepID=UPI003BF49445